MYNGDGSYYQYQNDDIKIGNESSNDLCPTSSLPSTPVSPRNNLFTSPRPKSALAKYIKSAQFTPYASTTRPKLLIDMNVRIEDDLKTLNSKKGLNEYERAFCRIDIFGSAFQLYLDETVIYKSILERIKFEYDTVHEWLKSKLENYSSLDAIINDIKLKNDGEIAAMTETSRRELSELKSKVALLESNMAKIHLDKTRADTQCNENKSKYEKLQKEYESLRSTSIALASSLSRSEEQTWQVQLTLSAKESEVNEHKGSTIKIADEIDKLQQIIQSMKVQQANLISKDAIQQAGKNILALQDELRRLNSVHRRLLIRYASIRSAIDAAFKIWDKNKGTLNNMSVKNRRAVELKVYELVAPLVHSSKASDNEESGVAPESSSTTDKLISMMDEGINPRIILDCLLDNMEATRSLDFASLGLDMETVGTSLSNVVGSQGLISDNVGLYNGNASSVDNGKNKNNLYLECLGTGQEVPLYLRFNGRVKNLFLSQWDATRLVNEVWDAKEAFDREDLINGIEPIETPIIQSKTLATPPAGFVSHSASADDGHSPLRSPSKKTNSKVRTGRKLKLSSQPVDVLERPVRPDMATFFNYFLRTKYKEDSRAMELAYSLMDAVERFGHVSDLKLFQLVLDGKANQEIRRDQLIMMEEFMTALNRDKGTVAVVAKETSKKWQFKNLIFDNNSDKNEWRLTADEILRVAKRTFTRKSEIDFVRLSKMLQMDSRESKLIDPAWLLMENQFGARSNFLEELKLQHLAECLQREKRILESIDKFAAVATAVAAASAVAMNATHATSATAASVTTPHLLVNNNKSPLNKTRFHSAQRSKPNNIVQQQQQQQHEETQASNAEIEMSVNKFREALMEAHPGCSRQEVTQLLCEGCDCSVEDVLLMEARRATIGVEVFKNRLKSRLLTAATRVKAT